MKLPILIIVALALTGCASPSWHPSVAEMARRAEVAGRPVPTPTTTPFENDPERRIVYLEWYWFGYNEALRGTTSSFCGSEHPMNDAQFEGHSDGNRDGINAYFRATATRPAG